MRYRFHFGPLLLSLAIFPFSATTPSITHAQFSAAASTDVSALDAAPAQKIALAGVPNGGKINDFLFRGAQPSKQGLVQLKQLGVTTIVAYRIAENGWSAEQAIKEMYFFGFRDGVFRPRIPREFRYRSCIRSRAQKCCEIGNRPHFADIDL